MGASSGGTLIGSQQDEQTATMSSSPNNSNGRNKLLPLSAIPPFNASIKNNRTAMNPVEKENQPNASTKSSQLLSATKNSSLETNSISSAVLKTSSASSASPSFINNDNNSSSVARSRDASLFQQHPYRPLASPARAFPSNANSNDLSLESSLSHNSGSRRRRGFLRYGESMESLFHLDASSSAEYWKLCRTVCDTNSHQTVEQNATAWRRILELRTAQVTQQTSLVSQKDPSNETDLIRLHRRATSHVAAAIPENPKSSLQLDLLHIWLSYARAQAAYGQEKDSRLTLQHIQNQKLGEQHTALYLALADIEKDDFVAAERALRLGIQRKAEPILALYDALRKLQTLKQHQQLTRSPKRACSQQQSSPKRRKTDSGRVELNSNGTESSATALNHNPNNMTDHKNAARIDLEKVPNAFAGSGCADAPSPNSNMSLDTESTLDTENGTFTMAHIETSTMSASLIETKDSIRFQLAPLITRSKVTERKLPAQSKKSSETYPAGIVVAEPKKNGSKCTPPIAALTKNEQPQPDNEESQHGTFTSLPKPIVPTKGETLKLETVPSSKSTTWKYATSAGRPDVLQPAACQPDALATTVRETTVRSRSSANESLAKDASLSSTSHLGTSGAVAPSHVSSRNRTMGRAIRSQRPPLQLKSFGLMAKVERVDPSQSELLKDEDESDSAPEDGTRAARKKESNQTPTKVKILKMDLSYMMNWDPKKRNTPVTQTNSSLKASHSKPQGLEKVEEPPSVSLSSSNLSATSNSGRSQSKSSNISGGNGATVMPDNTTKDRRAARRQKSLESSPTRAHDENEANMSALLVKTNHDFLPLVSEDNMLRVNGVPYAKLAVIGKGGSCKVYRALAKDWSVVAIKKVKLDNLEKKAIDGYSNEIALLKRLRGNPAIIQLHDSEVDFERKAIFLVMEPGEADLNHVLQKQALYSGGSRLNMNFIRLTWQVRLVVWV